jgi:uncharacterized beta-barrel protein YwiB (DUF1934 family)
VKPVLVTVQSIQRDEDGQELKLELVSAGKYYCKQNIQYIVYEESEITGMAGVTTIIKLLPDSAVLLRRGNVRQRQVFRKGSTFKATYQMPFGEVLIHMKTYEMEIHLVEGIGTVRLGYDVTIEGIGTSYNQLTITVQEDKS